jgi:phytoene synthase
MKDGGSGATREFDAVARQSEQALRKGSRSFNAAAILLDPQTRESARLLYAWCRHVDDVIDGQQLGASAAPQAAAQEHVLDALRAATAAAGRDEPQADPAFEALRRVMRRHAIPPKEPMALIDGFAMDVTGRVYESLDDTLDYAYHVAGVVGLMMARVLGVTDERLFDRACDLGLGFQLTNIARDVVEDHRAGRIYLPRRWLKQEGLDEETLALPQNRSALHRVALRLLEAAEPYYQSAALGTAALPLRSAWAIGTAAGVYRAIGTRIRRNGPAAWDARCVVPGSEKTWLAVVAGFGALRPRRDPGSPARPAELWSRPV